MSVKHELMKALQSVPDEAPLDVVEYHVSVALLLQHRLVDTARSRNLTLDEVRRRLKLWDE
jgi:hypothetical protein